MTFRASTQRRPEYALFLSIFPLRFSPYSCGDFFFSFGILTFFISYHHLYGAFVSSTHPDKCCSELPFFVINSAPAITCFFFFLCVILTISLPRCITAVVIQVFPFSVRGVRAYLSNHFRLSHVSVAVIKLKHLSVAGRQLVFADKSQRSSTQQLSFLSLISVQYSFLVSCSHSGYLYTQKSKVNTST